MSIVQAPRYEATVSFIDEENNIQNPTIPSNQDYVTKSANGFITLDVPVSFVLRSLNPRASDTFIWGTSVWGDNTKFLPTFNSIMGGMSNGYSAKTSEVGYSDFKLDYPLKFSIWTAAGQTKSFTIYFDRGWGIYATRIKVDGVQYTNNSYQFSFAGTEYKRSFEIEITHISQGGKPLVILAVFRGLSMTFHRWNGLKNFTASNRNSFDILSIGEWGIVTQKGNMEITDNFGEIQQLQEMGVLQNQQPMIIRMTYVDKDTQEEEWKVIGDYYSQFDYVFGKKDVPIELYGKVEDWHRLYQGRPMTENVSAYNLLRELQALTGVTFEISPNAEIFLKSINIRFCYLNNSTLYEAINKVLHIGMCKLWEEDGNRNILVDLYNYSRYQEGISPVYRINRTSTYGNPISSYSNIITGVEVEENKNYISGIFELKFNFSDYTAPPIVNPNITVTGAVITNTSFSKEVWWIDQENIAEVNKRNAYSAILIGYLDFTKDELSKFFYDSSFEKVIIRRAMYGATHIIPETILGPGSKSGIFELYFADSLEFYNFEDNEIYPLGTYGKIFFVNRLIDGKLYFKTKILYRTEYILSGVLSTSWYQHNFNLHFAEHSLMQQINFGKIPANLTLFTNELMQVDTKINNIPISKIIAEKIIENENGKQTLVLTVQKNDFYVYDRNGNRTEAKLSAVNGEMFEVRQFIEFWDDILNVPFIRDKEGKTKIFEIREVLKEKAGAPLMITLRLREV